MKKVFLSAFLIIFLGCSHREGRVSPSKELVIATAIPIGGVEPFSSRMGIGANLVDLLYRKVFSLTSEGKILPDLAKEVRWEEGGKKLRLILSDSRAEDVKYTLEKVREMPGGDFFEAFKNLEEVQIVSPLEIIFRLGQFDRAFVAMLGQLPIISKNSGKDQGEEFVVAENKPEEILLKRRQPSLTKVNQIKIQVIPSSRRAIRELVAVNIDLLFLVNEGDYQILSELPEFELKKMSTRMVYTVLDNRDSLADLPSVSWKAIDSFIDRDEYARHLGQTKVEAAQFPVFAEDPWWSESLNNSSEGKKADFIGLKRELSFLGNLFFERRAARILKRQLEEAGITLDLRNLPPQEFEQEVLQKKKFDLVMMPFNMKDPLMINYLVFHSPDSAHSLNITGYKNSKLDFFLEKARYAQDFGEAKAAFSDAIHAMMEDPPGLFLFWLKTPIVYRKSCSGFSLNSNEFFSSLKDVRCEPSATN